MSRIINTNDEEYTSRLQKLRALRSSMKPLVKQLYKMSAVNRDRWLEKDPLLREFVEMCERVTERNDD